MAAKDDGSLYAQGCWVKHHPRASATGISLGGTIAEATDERLAAEIVRRCNAFEPMREALFKAERALRVTADTYFSDSDEHRELTEAADACAAALALPGSAA